MRQEIKLYWQAAKFHFSNRENKSYLWNMITSEAGKELVIISGCSNEGMINTINYAKKLGGAEKIHAVLGGFYL
jgi:metal-dependent hydrolase (beta-lactamase superfamily II)